LFSYFVEFDKDAHLTIAYSGGVDSSVVASVATDVLGADRVTAVFFDTPLVDCGDRLCAKQVARERGFTCEVIAFDPLIIEAVRYNRADRCYYCKNALFSLLIENYPKSFVCDGTNADDDPARRPGMRALSELGILSPLRECGLTKEDVRACARELGLLNAERASKPCKAVSIPHDTLLTPALLVESIETPCFAQKDEVKAEGNSAAR